MANKDTTTDTDTDTDTNTDKHIKIGVLICFAPPLRRCVDALLSRLRYSVPPRFRTTIRATNIMSIRAASARGSAIAELR